MRRIWNPDRAFSAWPSGYCKVGLKSAPHAIVSIVLAALVVGGSRDGMAQSPLLPFTIIGDAIPVPLTGRRGDPVNGRAIVANRQLGLCLLCHSGPFPEEPLQGNLAPDMRGAGSRWSEGQLRLRIVDAGKLNARTIMPPYYRTDGLERVAPSFLGKPVLTAEQIEDVVAYLTALKE